MDSLRSSLRARSSVRTWGQRYVIALGVTFALTLGGVVGANVVIDAKINQIPRVSVKTADLPGPAQAGNFLVIGSDTRQFVNNEQQAEAFGSAQEETGQRSDTIMIVHVDPDQQRSLIVSIPRDLVVDVPGIGTTRVNAAFNEGPQKVIDTLQQNFGIQIHHYVEVNFESFQGIVNAIGRVHVYFPHPARDDYSGLQTDLPGCIGLNGDSALKFVRARHLEYKIGGVWQLADGNSDLDRIQRQQEFIRRLGSVAFREAVANPFTANEMADAVVPKLKIDQNLGRRDIFSLANTFRNVDPNDPSRLQIETFPNKPYGDNARLLPQQPEADEMAARLNDFSPPVTIKPGDVTVRVLNASGVDGLAKATLDALRQQFGFVPAGTGTAAEQQATTELRFAPGDQAKATLVRSFLGGSGTLVADSSAKQGTVVVVLGRDFKAVVAAPGAGPTTSTSVAAKGKGAKAPAPAPADPAAACAP